jgi:NAD(P)-dependent dehydrogenase (short-subunit alcohol dehydrogenase family)
MIHKQHPIGTGFNAASTADDVLGSVDLSGKNVIVTGGYSGIGLEVTRALSKAGAAITVGCRNPERAALVLADLANVKCSQLDLIDPLSVDAFAVRWLGSSHPLHILINGAVASGGPIRDDRGYETHFATNHLGHFQLTVKLLPALRAANGARVVNVSSGAQRFSDIQWDDIHLVNAYTSAVAYAQSKTANVLFAVELDRRWAEHGIRGYAVHPGVVAGTKLTSSVGSDALRAMGLIDEAGRPIIDPAVGKKTPQQGAGTIVFAATSPLLSGIGGVYLKDNEVSALDDEMKALTADYIPADIVSHSIDPQSAIRLWELSEQLLTLDGNMSRLSSFST